MTAGSVKINTDSNYCWRLALVEGLIGCWVREWFKSRWFIQWDWEKWTTDCPRVTQHSKSNGLPKYFVLPPGNLYFHFMVPEMSRRNVDPLEDPDYTLIVRVQDLGGMSENALSGTTRVQIGVLSNLWVSPGSITVRENLEETYPLVIAKVRQKSLICAWKYKHTHVCILQLARTWPHVLHLWSRSKPTSLTLSTH